MSLLDPSAAAAAVSCESLAAVRLPNTTITSARTVAAGAFTSPSPGVVDERVRAATKNLPEFCRVTATLTPTKESDIKIEVWLPAQNWNGKFMGVGNGGWAGTISYTELAQALQHGYATSSTDTGHSGPGGSFAASWEKYVDYSYRSEHEMTLRSKSLITSFYGNGAKLSYWNGCSTGGRQGLMEAQRFPDDYDGIIAGDPANPKAYINTWTLNINKRVFKEPDAFIPPSKFPMIHRAVVNACDALDGVKDGLIENPMTCHFDPHVLACEGKDEATCLTSPQVETAKMVFEPAKTRDGREIFPGHIPGPELGWSRFLSKEPPDVAVDQFKYVVHKDDPNWDWLTFDLEKDFALSEKIEKGTVNAIDPNLQKFASHGGKLIIYHGWSDPMVTVQSSIKYYRSVVDKMGSEKTSNLMRMFLAPGMGHCAGGEGPNTFDSISALEQWVEKGKAPDQIIASHATNGKVDRTRPLCPYPQIAKYKGSGSIDEAANFSCANP